MAAIRNTKRHGSLRWRCGSLLLSFLCVGLTFGVAAADREDQRTFASPEEAVGAVVKALKSDDTKALISIFGSDSEDLVFSGDPVEDNAGRERFISIYEQKNRLEPEGADKMVLVLGNDDFPFPIPVVKEGGAWYFDGDEGREELLARRIGLNELSVIQVCLAYVDAQREYALKDWDKDGLFAYAQKFVSDPGTHDGLYWEAKPGEEQSPLGSLVAKAQEEGYAGAKRSGEPVPFHGYYYRILKGQGRDAPGGAHDYLVKDQMIGGFALVAYPARYGASGIMTFIVNHEGIVYQKDLGESTEKIAMAMQLFDPNSTWMRVGGDAVALGK